MVLQKLCMHHLGAASVGLLFCILSCFLRGRISAQTVDCNTSLITLQPCYPYIEAGNTTNPETDCCNPLRALFASNATCLCEIAPIAQGLGISINQTRALEVATLCNQTDIPASVTSCLSGISQAPTPSISSNATVPPPSTPAPPNGTSSSSTDGSSGSLKRKKAFGWSCVDTANHAKWSPTN
ncbi:hypothetical protein GOP47_0012919 [Adiantum capillus-veneris]|uniref:Bifunctional inhibitor/plant lipid transfer protein/seed storage helical domain-containing protein n=1 Tax=Adiantum capillus-veneris TaxID=13818 RepID=A0A9D4USZ4_ADICA|nr:hypothetical protein GOP47_0012919 [Adiantum capillus-veneris]